MGKRAKEETEKSGKSKRQKVEKEDGDKPEGEEEPEVARISVPIAHPHATEHDNLTKKLLSIVKYATKNKSMVRGIKEVTKIVRKKKGGKAPLVVLAADISPLDVISHMPGLCDEKEVPYIWVPSRSDLGAATLSKRPTSAVIIKAVPEDKEDSFKKVQKLVSKLHKNMS